MVYLPQLFCANSSSCSPFQVIEFGGENIDFDTEGYNGMTHVLNNVKAFYRSG